MTPVDFTAYRAELQAALSVLGPQIEGLGALAKANLSQPAIQAVSAQLLSRRNRLRLIQNVIGAIDVLSAAMAALTNDGYPALPTIPIQETLFEEIMREIDAMISAIEIFSSGAISIEIAEAVFTKQSPPSA